MLFQNSLPKLAEVLAKVSGMSISGLAKVKNLQISIS
jgi:hypothetical protein